MTGSPFASGIDDAGRASWRDVVLWTSAFTIVVGLQGAGAYWLINRPPEVAAAEGAAPEAIMLELAPMTTTTEEAVEDLAPDQQVAVQQEEIAPTPEPVEEAVDPPPEPEVVPEEPPPPEDVAEPEPEPLPEPEPEPELEPPPEPETEVLPEPLEPPPEEAEPVEEPVEEVIPEPVEAPEPAVLAPVPVQLSARLQELRARPKPTRQFAPTPPPKKAAQRSSAPPPAEAPRAERAASAQPGATRSAPSVSPARWQSQLMSHLSRRKQYPRASQSRREEGTVQLRFSIDANGNVLSASIARSSGYPDLDQAAISMINRASPVPAPPAELAKSRTTLTIPVEFDL